MEQLLQQQFLDTTAYESQHQSTSREGGGTVHRSLGWLGIMGMAPREATVQQFSVLLPQSPHHDHGHYRKGTMLQTSADQRYSVRHLLIYSSLTPSGDHTLAYI